jgi:hypothetical protein
MAQTPVTEPSGNALKRHRDWWKKVGGVEVFLACHVFESDLNLILTRCNEW